MVHLRSTRAVLLAVALGAVAPVAMTTAPAMAAPANTPWYPRSAVVQPGATQFARMDYDFPGGHTILFGGNLSSGVTSDQTWNWDGTTWSQLLPAVHPSGRSRHTMTSFRGANGHILLFGGDASGSGTSPLGDTWKWTGSAWTQVFPATSPPARWGAAMGWDPARGEIVLFGGVGAGGVLLNDTWVWNGTSWTQRFPATSPSARREAAAAWQRNTSTVTLFGGRSSGGTALADTWRWNGTTWTQLFPATSPPARYGHGLCFDEFSLSANNPRLVLVGGAASSGAALEDTWEFSGTNWFLNSATSAAGGRYGMAIGPVFFSPGPLQTPDPKRVTIFGGSTTSPIGTWTYQV